jgi:hypothetical protein
MDFDPPEPTPRRRARPFIGGTVSPDVAAALQAKHQELGGPFASALEAALRRGLGLEEVPPRAA